jgi:hypothetical protein
MSSEYKKSSKATDAEDIFDTEHDGSIQTIVNQSDRLAETGISDNTDTESWQGLSNSEFKDLDHVSRATSLCCPGADI